MFQRSTRHIVKASKPRRSTANPVLHGTDIIHNSSGILWVVCRHPVPPRRHRHLTISRQDERFWRACRTDADGDHARSCTAAHRSPAVLFFVNGVSTSVPSSLYFFVHRNLVRLSVPVRFSSPGFRPLLPSVFDVGMELLCT